MSSSLKKVIPLWIPYSTLEKEKSDIIIDGHTPN